MTLLFSRRLLHVLALCACLSPSDSAQAESPLFSAGIGFEFASGSYGAGIRTDSIYLPVTIAVYPTQRLGFSLEIPYVYQSSSGVNAGLYSGQGRWGTMMRKEAAAMAGAPTGGAGTGGGGPGGGTPATSAAVSHQSRSGLGDITAKGGYVLVPEGEVMPRVRPYLFVKFPTADSDKALGTGEFDEGFAVELSKQFGNWHCFAELGYTFQGESDLLPLKDYATYNAGAGYAFGDRLLAMVILKGAGAPVEGASDLLETRVKLKYLATEATGIEGYLARGVTRSSPDYGGGLALFYDF